MTKISQIKEIIEHIVLEYVQVLSEAKIDVAIKNEKDETVKKFLNILKAKNLAPKYVYWAARYARQEKDSWFGNPDESDAQKMLDLLSKFEELVLKKKLDNTNIDAYSRDDLIKIISDKKDVVDSEAKWKEESKDIVKIYEDNQYLIMMPNSRAASCKYGAGTQWCIASRDEDYFEKYKQKDAEFIFIINKSNNDKDALLFYPGQKYSLDIYDAKDDFKDQDYIIDKYPKEIIDIINKYTDDNFNMPLFDMEIQSDPFNKLVRNSWNYNDENLLGEFNSEELFSTLIVAGDTYYNESPNYYYAGRLLNKTYFQKRIFEAVLNENTAQQIYDVFAKNNISISKILIACLQAHIAGKNNNIEPWLVYASWLSSVELKKLQSVDIQRFSNILATTIQFLNQNLSEHSTDIMKSFWDLMSKNVNELWQKIGEDEAFDNALKNKMQILFNSDWTLGVTGEYDN